MTPPHLVLAGAGHAQLDLLSALVRQPLAGWDVTLVTPLPAFHYSGMLPAVIAGLVPADAASIPVAAIARKAGLRVIESAVTALDAPARLLTLASGARVSFDLLSLDVGSVPAGSAVPGVLAHAFPMRPFTAALGLMTRLDEAASAMSPGATIPAVVVGGGAAGVEVALAVRARILAAGHRPQVTIVDAAAADGLPLAGFSPPSRTLALRALAARDITFVCGDITGVDADAVSVAVNGHERALASIATAWVTGSAPSPWLTASGLACDHAGYPFASDTLALDAAETVFGGGDCVGLRDAPATPKAGVYAVRMAPVLAANVVAVARGNTARARYTPQRSFLALLSTSDGRALLRWRSVTLESRWAQWLKTRIDERYLRRYRTLPV